ncbi:TIGR01457 family HAD-type hydrolase [Brevibacillus migulae]|uniref:TIGR01457 family HAD-type hydrolase n=1 Tax=Brevibacillus migulae TaxID=1644114 RepID=UPI00106E0DFF|nr:TIGR01457 family HAD-type hydrolase [Brevibacillus migulae]
MKTYRGYLLDLDGTIYRGKEVIPEAVAFIRELRKANIPFLYVTNNSTTTPELVAQRLSDMGIETAADEVYTSSMGAAAYLQERYPAGTDVYTIGEAGLHAALAEIGCKQVAEGAKVVIAGMDRAFTYEKLAAAATAIRHGAQFIATNRDPALPTERGLMPGSGSLIAAIATASGVEPVVIGKPERILVDYALERLGTSREETLIVGDNLLTDIGAGTNSGIDSLLVLTGYSRQEDLETSNWQPTHLAKDLMEWWQKCQA